MASDREFVEWIRNKLREGYTTEEIVKILETNGYSEKYIELARNPDILPFKTEPWALKNEAKKTVGFRKSLIFKVFVIVVLVILIVFAVMILARLPSSEAEVLDTEEDLSFIKDMSLCYDLGDGGREDCFMDRISIDPSLASAEICNSMMIPKNADKCRFMVATESNNLDMDTCNSVEGYKSLCYQRLAVIRGDTVYCEYAAEPSECMRLVGK